MDWQSPSTYTFKYLPGGKIGNNSKSVHTFLIVYLHALRNELYASPAERYIFFSWKEANTYVWAAIFFKKCKCVRLNEPETCNALRLSNIFLMYALGIKEEWVPERHHILQINVESLHNRSSKFFQGMSISPKTAFPRQKVTKGSLKLGKFWTTLNLHDL